MEKDFAFKRLNFFRGFLTTEKDWNDGEMYHIMKRRMHNKTLHAPGVVRHFLGGLKVTQRDRGDLSVVISPGYAIDGSGRDIYLPQPVIKQIEPQDFKLPGTVYIVVRYAEEPTDFIAYKENPLFKGHRRIAEYAKIDVLPTEPDINEEVEIARIELQPDVKQIRNPLDPNNPRPNEIDMRFVPVAGVAGSFITPTQRAELKKFLMEQMDIYLRVGHILKVESALDVAHAFMQLHMLLSVNALDIPELFDIMEMVLTLQKALIEDIATNHPKIDREKFSLYRRYIEGITLQYTELGEGWTHLITNETRAGKQLQLFLPQKKEEKVVKDNLSALLERIKVKSDRFPGRLKLGDIMLRLVDEFDVTNQEADKAHKFRVVGPKDKYRSRQNHSYPDNVRVEDVGIHFRGGFAQWEVENLRIGKRTVLIFRVDVGRGNFKYTVEINGSVAGEMHIDVDDLDYRWRNWPFVIPAKLITEPTLRVKLIPVQEDRDVNFFRVWTYQEE